MVLSQERLHWRDDSARVDVFVDAMIDILQRSGASSPSYMAVDMAYRPFLQWVHSAHSKNVNPHLVRNSAVHLMNIMILELANRMNDVKNNSDGAKEWVHDFLDAVFEEVERDLEEIAVRTNQGNN